MYREEFTYCGKHCFVGNGGVFCSRRRDSKLCPVYFFRLDYQYVPAPEVEYSPEAVISQVR